MAQRERGWSSFKCRSAVMHSNLGVYESILVQFGALGAAGRGEMPREIFRVGQYGEKSSLLVRNSASTCKPWCSYLSLARNPPLAWTVPGSMYCSVACVA